MSFGRFFGISFFLILNGGVGSAADVNPQHTVHLRSECSGEAQILVLVSDRTVVPAESQEIKSQEITRPSLNLGPAAHQVASVTVEVATLAGLGYVAYVEGHHHGIHKTKFSQPSLGLLTLGAAGVTGRMLNHFIIGQLTKGGTHIIRKIFWSSTLLPTEADRNKAYTYDIVSQMTQYRDEKLFFILVPPEHRGSLVNHLLEFEKFSLAELP